MTVAIERECFGTLPLFALEVALALVQAQAAIASAPAVWLLTRVMQAPGQPGHAGSWGLARSARAEASLPVHCIDRTAAMVVSKPAKEALDRGWKACKQRTAHSS